MRALHVTPLELTEAGTALGGLGIRLLEDVLSDGPGLTLGHWLSRRDAQLFDRAPLRRLGWKRAMRVARHRANILRPYVFYGAPLYVFGERLRESAATERLAVEWHGAEALLIADRMLPLVALHAWESPAFQQQAATLLADHLRQRLLVSLVELPVPRVDPVVVWLLVAASPIRLPGLARLHLTQRRERRAVERLQNMARTIVHASSMPDGFWARWITWQVTRRPHPPLPATWDLGDFGGTLTGDAERQAAATVRSFADLQRAVPLPAIYHAWYGTQGVTTCSRWTRFRRWLGNMPARFARSPRFAARSKQSSTA